jgi:HD-like signal output (HDOD) protein
MVPETATSTPGLPRPATDTFLSPPQPELIAEESRALRRWLDGFLDDPTADLPRLPSVALEILELTHQPESSLEEITSLLGREPVLAAKVLRLANSALYGTTTACASLKAALVRMGISVVRDLVMEAAFAMTVIRADGFGDTLEQIRRHSTAVAWVSRFVARNTAMEAENAFLIGLLKDLGLTVGLIGLSEFLKRENRPPVLSAERWRAVELNHEAFGARLLDSWKLPPALTFVVGHHHELVVQGHPHPSVAVLMVAESIVNASGWHIRAKAMDALGGELVLPCSERASQEQVAASLESLLLTERHFAIFVKDTERVLQSLREQFGAPLK